MNNPLKNSTGANTLRLLVAALIVLAFFGRAAAQTPGGTVISNQASATYSDGTNSYSTVSNTVTVTVSNVSGLAITPDAGSNPTVVAGQTGVLYDFTVTNTGNFTDQVRFLRERRQCSRRWAGHDHARGHRRGQQRHVQWRRHRHLYERRRRAVREYRAERIDSRAGRSQRERRRDRGADCASAARRCRHGSPPSTIKLRTLQPNEVRTVSATSVNGLREARGDISVHRRKRRAAAVDADGARRARSTLGSDITLRMASVQHRRARRLRRDLNASTQVYIIAPIPARTVLKSGQTFPAGTLYTTSALTTAPLSATWSSSAPVPLSNTTRLAFPVGATLAAGGACSCFHQHGRHGQYRHRRLNTDR